MLSRAGSGTLDECNSRMIGGTYTYFATDTYPFFPRCFKGHVSRDFMHP
ncbi:MAG: YHYH protein [Maritimibacter sp.]